MRPDDEKKKIEVLFHLTPEPGSTFGASKCSTVAESLISAHNLVRGKGSWAPIQVTKDGQTIYDTESLARAVDRMEKAIREESKSVEEAAAQIAAEDGYK